MIPKEKAFSKLQILYEQAQAPNSPEITAHAIYQVMEEYDHNPLLSLIGKIIFEQECADLVPLRGARKQVTEELNDVFQHLKKWHKGAKDYDISEELIIYEEMEKLPIESGLVTPNGQFQSLQRAMIFLNRKYPTVTNQLISEYATLDGKGNIDRFTFAPSIDAWNIEDKKIHNIKKSRVWYAWFELVRAYLTHNPAIFATDIDTFKYYLRILYTFTMENASQLLQKSSKKDALSFDETDGQLYIPGYAAVNFDIKSKQIKFVSLFFPNALSIKKAIDIIYIHQDVFDHHKKSLEIEEKTQIYNLRRDINQKIEVLTGIKEFFKIKDGAIFINPDLFK